MGNTGKADFFAFVSHKSADRDFALKAKKFIENYRLPESIRKNTNWPKRLSPICCYEDDFSSNPLLTEMEEKLRRSQFLIVICSKDTEPGGSKYVNFEIETFIKQKRAEGIDPLERIIPIIVSGAFDSQTEECCPAALKALGENRPIAADRRKYKSDREVFLHAISGMLDIDYAVMVNRDRKKRRITAAIAGAVCLSVLLLGGGLLYYMVPKDWHYVDFVMQKGLPVGIGKLTQSQYERMNAHYVITTQRGRIIQLKYVNSQGSLIKHDLHYRSDRPSKYVFDYDSGGLTSVTYYDEYNQPCFVMKYYNRELTGVDLRESGGGNGVYFIGAGYGSNPEKLLNGTGYMDISLKSGSDSYAGLVSRLGYIYNEKGFVTKVLFHADSSNKRVSDNGVFGFEYELDDLGRVRKVYYLDIAQNRTANSEGVYCTEYIYDQNHDLVGLKHFDKKGALTGDENEIIQLRWTYDKNHNRTQLEVLDAAGEPVMDSNVFYAATILYSTDTAGHIILSVDKDVDGPIRLEAGGFRSYQYDKNGLVSKQFLLDAKGTPTFYPELGFAVIEYTRDHQGRVIGLRYRDVDGTPVNCYNGFSYKETAYHSSGEISRIAFYDAAGKPVNHIKCGYSVETREYDSLVRMTVNSYWGENQEPVNSTGPDNFCGFHKCVLTYEDQLNGFAKVTQTFYDANGQMVNCKAYENSPGFAQMQIVSQDGYITFLALYDQDGTQIDICGENSRIYNAKGELEETRKRIQPDGTVKSLNVYTYDGQGMPKRYYYEYLDKGKLSKCDTLYYENGRRSSETYAAYDENGELELETFTQYNTEGKEIFYKSLRHDSPDFFHFEEKTEYPEPGKKLTVTQTWDIDGKLVSQSAKAYGASDRQLAETGKIFEDGVLLSTYTKEFTYNADGSYSQKQIWYDPDGKQTSEEVTHYDSKGKPIKE